MKINEIKFWLTNMRWLSDQELLSLITTLNRQKLTTYKAFRDQRLLGMI